MLIYEYKPDGNQQQYQAIDEAIRIVQFIKSAGSAKILPGRRVTKSLSVRTHICPACGLVLDRDENAAVNILHAELTILFLMAFAGTLGHRGTSESSENASGQSAAPRRSPRRKASKQAG